MAGVVPQRPNNKSGRKQWTLHGGSKDTLNRLRTQLANDGYSESQVVLAKQLLEEPCELDVEKRENARLGVYWLIKASEQGNEEATELLKKCLQTGKGITEHNYLDVKACINMTQDEKLARKAAREMFASLSNGGEFITSDQLQKHMIEIDKKEKFNKITLKDASLTEEAGDIGELNGDIANDYESESEEDIDWSQRSDINNEKLTRDHLVSAAVDYSHGQLPLVNRVLCLVEPDLRALDHIPLLQRSILHPLLALKILYFRLIKFLGSHPFFRNFPFAKTDVQLLFLMFVYSFVSTENMIYFFPLFLYYVTFFVMVITTFKMLQSQRDFQEFRVWSGLFITYSGGSLNPQEAEFQFIRNNLKPYGHFFVALLCNLLMYPIIVEQWIPQSELTILSFCLTFITLFSFMLKERHQKFPDMLAFLSFAVNILAKYPYETDPVVTQGWRFLDLKVPTFASYIVGNGIEICLNFRLMFYIFIPILFVCMAARQKWRGTYKHLIPHCVTLSWLQLVIISSQGATMYGLLRGTLALVGFVLFLPLVGLTTVLLPAAALTKWIITSGVIVTICIFIVFSAIGLTISWLLAKSRFSQYIGFIQISFSVISFYLLMQSVVPQDDLSVNPYSYKRQVHSLSWDQFQNYCHQPAWENNNVAKTQLKCSQLEGMPVVWDGYVNEVKIKSISNAWKMIFDMLPNSLSQYMYCLYGEEIQSNCDDFPDLVKNNCLMFYDILKSKRTCTLEKHTRYEFEITVRMQSGLWGKSAEVILMAGNLFKNFSLELKPNDKIVFKGLLTHNVKLGSDGILGGLKPYVNLEEIKCIVCHKSDLTEQKINSRYVIDIKKLLTDLYVGVKCVLNFLFHPLVVFK